MLRHTTCYSFFFFNDTATTEIYTLSLHDALPISTGRRLMTCLGMANEKLPVPRLPFPVSKAEGGKLLERSEEHTSELQSQSNLVCRLLLEKKKKNSIADRN